MRVVLDTNVIVSGLNFSGNEQRVLHLAVRRRYDLYLSTFILQEVSGVLARKFSWSQERTSQAIRLLSSTATVIEPRRILPIIQANPADNRVLACAVESDADYLVTGDRRHLLPLKVHVGTRIINAVGFLPLVEK
jgi:putative PIN family toxin of toxin-antitoxin system